jgi:hypothetical protein
MSDHDWYEVIEGMSLQQGDILRDCPVFAISGSALWPLEVAADVEIEAKVFDLVVMTQSCDLENEKVEDVLLAQLVAWPDAVRVEVARGNEAVRSRKFRKLLIDGNVPGLSLLHQRSSRPVLPWSVVDFHRLFTLPKTFLARFAAESGPRLRLRSPYREHLAQAFARYFMRVGLPHDARSFEQEGAVV